MSLLNNWRRIGLDVLVQGAVATFWHWVFFKGPGLLLENAVISWIDDQLAEAFGISSPTAEDVTSWLIPLALGFPAILILHIYSKEHSAQKRRIMFLTLLPTYLLVFALAWSAKYWYGPQSQNLPGFAYWAYIRLYDMPNERRKYIFDAISTRNVRCSFYLSARDMFRFTVVSADGEPYSLDVPLGSGGIPIDRFIFLYLEASVGSQRSYLRVIVDDKEVKSRTLDFPIDISSSDWRDQVVGADLNRSNNAPFIIKMFGITKTSLTKEQIDGTYRASTKFLNTVDDIRKQKSIER